MSVKNTTIMAVVLLLLSVYVWRYELDSRSDVETAAKAEEGELLFKALSKDAFTWLLLASPEGSFAARKKPKSSDWSLINPPGISTESLGAPADGEAIKSIIEGIADLRFHNKIEVAAKKNFPEDYIVYGFSKPELTVSFNSGGQEQQLVFGSQHPISKRRYLRRPPAADVYMVDEDTFQSISKHRTSIRDKRPFSFKEEQISEVWIERSNKSGARFVKNTEEKWFYNARNRQYPVDDSRIKYLLNSLADVEVREFVDKPLKVLGDYGFSNPRIRVSVFLDNESGRTKKEILFSEIEVPMSVQAFVEAPKTHYYFTIGGEKWIYRLAGKTPRVLFKPVRYFRHRLPFEHVNPSDVRQITIKSTGEAGQINQSILVRKNSSWTIESKVGASKPANSEAIQQWLAKLLKAKVLSFLGHSEEKDVDISKPYWHASLLVESQGQNNELELFLGAALERSSERQGPKSPSRADAPRFGAFILDQRPEVYVILSSSLEEQIVKPPQYFFSKK